MLQTAARNRPGYVCATAAPPPSMGLLSQGCSFNESRIHGTCTAKVAAYRSEVIYALTQSAFTMRLSGQIVMPTGIVTVDTPFPELYSSRNCAASAFRDPGRRTSTTR